MESYQELNKKKVLFSFLLVVTLFSFSFISAQPWLEQTGELFVTPVHGELVQQNTDQHFHMHLTNATNFISNSTAQCGFTLNSQTGNILFKDQDIPYHAGSENEWGIDILGGNFSALGFYIYTFECNTSLQAGTVTSEIVVTPTGFASSDLNYLVFVYLGLMFLFYLLARTFDKKWKIKLFFDLMAITTGILLVNSASLIFFGSGIDTMNLTLLIVSIVAGGLLFLYLFIYSLIEVFNYFRKKEKMKWEVSGNPY